MSLLQDVRSVTAELSTAAMLRFLITEKFPGKTAMTASLRAPSLVVLKMAADIDRAIPVVFCHPGHLFPESLAYRERIVELLGLENVSVTQGREVSVAPGDNDHYEQMWAESLDGSNRIHEFVHVNDTLSAYDCWISAVYHFIGPAHVTHRVDVESRLIRVDPLRRWSKDDVRQFMRDNGLPFHPRAARERRRPEPFRDTPPVAPSYHY